MGKQLRQNFWKKREEIWEKSGKKFLKVKGMELINETGKPFMENWKNMYRN